MTGVELVGCQCRGWWILADRNILISSCTSVPWGASKKTVSGQGFKRVTHGKLLEDAGPTSVLQQVYLFAARFFQVVTMRWVWHGPMTLKEVLDSCTVLIAKRPIGGTEDAIWFRTECQVLVVQSPFLILLAEFNVYPFTTLYCTMLRWYLFAFTGVKSSCWKLHCAFPGLFNKGQGCPYVMECYDVTIPSHWACSVSVDQGLVWSCVARMNSPSKLWKDKCTVARWDTVGLFASLEFHWLSGKQHVFYACLWSSLGIASWELSFSVIWALHRSSSHIVKSNPKRWLSRTSLQVKKGYMCLAHGALESDGPMRVAATLEMQSSESQGFIWIYHWFYQWANGCQRIWWLW